MQLSKSWWLLSLTNRSINEHRVSDLNLPAHAITAS
jgi:hypothetical protein